MIAQDNLEESGHPEKNPQHVGPRIGTVILAVALVAAALLAVRLASGPKQATVGMLPGSTPSAQADGADTSPTVPTLAKLPESDRQLMDRLAVAAAPHGFVISRSQALADDGSVLDAALRNDRAGISIAFTLSRNINEAPTSFLRTDAFGTPGEFSSSVTPKAANVSTSLRSFTSEARAYSPATKRLLSISIVRDASAAEVAPDAIDFATSELVDVLIA